MTLQATSLTYKKQRSLHQVTAYLTKELVTEIDGRNATTRASAADSRVRPCRDPACDMAGAEMLADLSTPVGKP